MVTEQQRSDLARLHGLRQPLRPGGECQHWQDRATAKRTLRADFAARQSMKGYDKCADVQRKIRSSGCSLTGTG